MTPQIIHYQTPPCPHCKKSSILHVPQQSIFDWKKGMYIQDAFPTLDSDDRELLKTGFHTTCWNEAFGDDED